MEERSVVVEEVSVGEQPLRPAPHDVEMLCLVAVDAIVVQVVDAQSRADSEKDTDGNPFLYAKRSA